MEDQRMVRGPLVYLAMAIVASAGIAFVLGNFEPEVVPDTASYLAAAPWPDLLGMLRTPFYGWFVTMLGGKAIGYALVPLVQFAALAAATILLFQAMQSYGVGERAALALTIPIPFGNPALLYLGDVHPEILAISLVLIALACLLLLCRECASTPAAVGLCLSLGSAYLMKPAFLTFIGVMPVMALFLMRLRGALWWRAVGRAGLVSFMIVLPFLSYASIRCAVTGSFHVVSFGGFASSGMAGLMLRPQTIDRLPERHHELASYILQKREELAAQSLILPIPLNSRNERSFPSAALGYFDVLARSYDDVVFRIVSQASLPSEDWVDFDRRLQSFTESVIKAEPAYYLAWIIGATTRFVGLAVTANATFVVGVLALLASSAVACLRHRPRVSSTTIYSRDLAVLAVLVGGYTLANYLPAVLMTFPARRYVDSAALLLAAFPMFGMLVLWRQISGAEKD